MFDLKELAREVGVLLRERKLTLCTVESATGGLIAGTLTEIPGSSDYYKGSIVAYSNDIKVKLAGVSPQTLSEHGAVSSLTAEEMAIGGCRALAADICLSDTGIAGPGGAGQTKPVGLFYLGLAHGERVWHRQFEFSGSRAQNRSMATGEALLWLREYLNAVKGACFNVTST